MEAQSERDIGIRVIGPEKKSSTANWLIFFNILLTVAILMLLFVGNENVNKTSNQSSKDKTGIQQCPKCPSCLPEKIDKKYDENRKVEYTSISPTTQNTRPKPGVFPTDPPGFKRQEIQKQLSEGKGSQGAFELIYGKKYWDPTGKHPSGFGSIPEDRIDYLLLLQSLVDHPKINKVVDIGFGDFQISGRIRFPKNKTYHGYDVVETNRRPNETNKFFSIIKGIRYFNDTGDLLLTKDVIQHWPNSQIDYYLKNVVPKFKYALITNDYSDKQSRPDIKFGQWAAVNLDSYLPNVHLKEIQPGCYLIPGWPV